MIINQFIIRMVCVGYAFVFFIAQSSYASQITHENDLTEDQNYHALKGIAFDSIDQAQQNLDIQKCIRPQSFIQNAFFVMGHDLYEITPQGKETYLGKLNFNELESEKGKKANIDQLGFDTYMIYSIFYPSGRPQYELEISSSYSRGKSVRIVCYYDELNEWDHPKSIPGSLFLLRP